MRATQIFGEQNYFAPAGERELFKINLCGGYYVILIGFCFCFCLFHVSL